MHDCIIEEHLTYVLRSSNSTDLANTKKSASQFLGRQAWLGCSIRPSRNSIDCRCIHTWFA